MHRHGGVGSPPPQGSSLGSGLCCPGPSSLNRPHPPHSRAHRDFAAWRLIRDAFAVRERLGDPRVVPGFRCPFLPGMPSSLTPGSSGIVMVQFSDADIGLRRDLSGSALPSFPQSASRGARFRGFTVRLRYGLPDCSPPFDGSNRSPSPRGLLLPGFRRLGHPATAGYDYNMDWIPLLAGLSPAGIAASLAAPDPDEPDSGIGSSLFKGLRRPLRAFFFLPLIPRRDLRILARRVARSAAVSRSEIGGDAVDLVEEPRRLVVIDLLTSAARWQRVEPTSSTFEERRDSLRRRRPPAPAIRIAGPSRLPLQLGVIGLVVDDALGERLPRDLALGQALPSVVN